ncbi:strictosidine synthase [Rhodoligotrophos defluvii]|uniref:strictosidine synthase n=1 Tax=Rhodoligotrophos defluvii TaxID=2561934 RepID=UPI0010C9739B|nr:strictosidine synthase [Rhodoligotrophos defluvii]
MNLIRRELDRLTGRGTAAVTVPPMDGALKPNQHLEEAEALAAPAPDNLTVNGGQVLYTSGREIRALASGKPIHVCERTITCLAAGPGGVLAIGLAGLGIRMLSPDGTLRAAGGARIRNATAAMFRGADLIVCEGSARHSPEHWQRDLMETGPADGGSGSVWICAADGSERRLGAGLRYPYGVLAGQDGGIVISESWSHRLLALDPNGSAPARRLVADLPGYPARMAPAADGACWLAVFAPRSQLIEFVLREDSFRRRMMAQIEPDYWISPALASGRSFLEPLQGGAVKQMGILKPWAPSRSYGLVIKLDSAWNPVLSLHSRADGRRHGTTSVLEAEGQLFVASKGGDAILKLPAGDLPKT